MSIQTQIDRIKTRVTETFAALQEKGVIDTSTEKKLDDLPSIIQNSELGGGSGSGSVDASVIQFIERSTSNITNSSLTKLGAYTAHKSAFQSVSFTKVTEIGEFCFSNSSSLSSVNLPALTTAGDNAFDSCDGLTTITLPKLTTAGQNLFGNCLNLKTCKFPALVTTGQYMLNGTSVEEITDTGFPVLSTVGSYAFSNMNNLKKIDSSAITTVGYCGFSDNYNLEEINLPNLTTIESSGFQNVYNGSKPDKLTSYSFPKLETAGDSAFYSNNNLKIVNLPMLTSLGISTFNSCGKLETVILPECTHIGASCFSGCTNLNTFTAPKVTNIDSKAFYGCYSLKKVEFPNLITLQSNNVFSTSYMREISLPNLTTIPASTFNTATALLLAYYPKVTSIESNAFSTCTSLQKIWIPKDATVSASDSSYYYYLFSMSPFVQIYTDATEKPANWGEYFNRWTDDGSKLLTVHYGATKSDFDNQKVINVELVNNNTSIMLQLNDGVVSNFSSDLYTRLYNNAYNAMSNVEFVVKFTTPSTEPTDVQYLVYNAYFTGLALGAISDNKLTLARYHWVDSSYKAITTLELNTTYYIKMRIDGEKIRFFLSTDGATYNYLLTDKDPNNRSDSFNNYLSLGTNIDNTAYYWQGAIDFNGCFIKQGDETLWTGILNSTVNSGTDTGYIEPEPEDLDTDQLVAHWGFDGTWVDSIVNLPISEYSRYKLMADEHYRGTGSAIIQNNSYSGRQTDISKLGLTFDNDWSMSFRIHSDYFKQSKNDGSYWYEHSIGLQNGRLNSTSAWDSYYQYFVQISDAGYEAVTFVDPQQTQSISTDTVRPLLIDDWNKYVIQHSATDKTISLYLNGSLLYKLENVVNNHGTDYNTFTQVYLSNYSTSNGQYIDDICLYKKLLIS